MKISKILLFIAGVLAGLALICVLMPKEGIQIGGVHLEFPTLTEVMTASSNEEDDSTANISPEELMAQRVSAIQGERVEEFRSFCKDNPSRIYLPGGDETYLDPLFDAMDNAGKKQVRIVHYGDSQLECDRISGDLRERFQAEFGGSGVGMVPALQTIATYSLSQSTSPSLGHYLNYGSSSFRASHNRYGAMAQVNHVAGGATLTFKARDSKKYPHAFPVTSVTVLASGSGSMSVKCDSASYSLASATLEGGVNRYTVRIPEGADNLSLSINGTFDVYGVQLDDTIGVTIDNVPMRGCSGTIFTTIDRSTVEAFYKNENVKLIILQYGGNSVPSVSGPKSISGYMTRLRSQIRMFREIAPNSCILFIGPADMATRKGGVLQTYPILPEVIDSLREMSLSEGVAFWDMYASMGGKNSIIKWNQASPQLAGSDYIHFTPKGAAKISDIFYETLQFYYKFYRMRTGKEQDAIKQELDSAENARQREMLEQVTSSVTKK